MDNRTIIFDFDGTLANSFPLVLRIANDFAEKFGYAELDKQKIEMLREKPAREVFKSLHISFWKLPILVWQFKSELHKRIQFLKPVEGITEVLAQLYNAGYSLGIITSNSEENVMEFLKKYNLERYFTHIHCGGSVFGKGKFLRHLIDSKNLELQNVVYVGDEVRDIDTAKEAEVKIISVEWGYNSKKVLKKNNPDVLIQEPDDLLKVIEFVYD